MRGPFWELYSLFAQQRAWVQMNLCYRAERYPHPDTQQFVKTRSNCKTRADLGRFSREEAVKQHTGFWNAPWGVMSEAVSRPSKCLRGCCNFAVMSLDTGGREAVTVKNWKQHRTSLAVKITDLEYVQRIGHLPCAVRDQSLCPGASCCRGEYWGRQPSSRRHWWSVCASRARGNRPLCAAEVAWWMCFCRSLHLLKNMTDLDFADSRPRVQCTLQMWTVLFALLLPCMAGSRLSLLSTARSRLRYKWGGDWKVPGKIRRLVCWAHWCSLLFVNMGFASSAWTFSFRFEVHYTGELVSSFLLRPTPKLRKSIPSFLGFFAFWMKTTKCHDIRKVSPAFPFSVAICGENQILFW